MRIHSTCTACNTLLRVSELGQQLHPTCQTTFPTGDPLTDAYLSAVDLDDEQQIRQLEAALDAEDARPRSLLAAAVAYAEFGWPVFPLQPFEKIPYPRSRGFEDATTDTNLVRKWWTKAPDSNIGLATGHAFDVLDVDFVLKSGKATGAHEVWPELRDSGQLPDAHGWVTTPRGGVHLYLASTGGGNKAGFLPGLDYRGVGGYVVAPPSRRVDGRRYAWWMRPSPTITGATAEAATAA